MMTPTENAPDRDERTCDSGLDGPQDSAHGRAPGPGTASGTPVPVRWTKWPGTPHWEHECVWLGSDEHGDWLGQRAGTRSWRPGRDVVAGTANVVLVPRDQDWVATFYPPGHEASMEVYIDLGHAVGWSTAGPTTVVGIDMDLDVVRDSVRGTWVDDEDELEEHAALWSYPSALVEHLQAVADVLHEAVETRTPPFDGPTPARWLSRLGSTGAP